MPNTPSFHVWRGQTLSKHEMMVCSAEIYLNIYISTFFSTFYRKGTFSINYEIKNINKLIGANANDDHFERMQYGKYEYGSCTGWECWQS